MEKEYKIIITKPCNKELNKIIRYIAYKIKEPNIAKRKFKNITNKIYTLDKFPERCPIVYGYKENIRKLIFDNYIVIYQIKENTRTSIYSTYISFKTKLFKKILIIQLRIIIKN